MLHWVNRLCKQDEDRILIDMIGLGDFQPGTLKAEPLNLG